MLSTNTLKSIQYAFLSKEEMQQCKILFHYFIQTHLLSYGYPRIGEDIEISRNTLRKNFINCKSNALKFLIENDIIICDNKYCSATYNKKFAKSLSYRLNYKNDYFIIDEEVDLTKTNLRKYEKIRKEVSLPSKEAHKQMNFIKKLNIGCFNELLENEFEKAKLLEKKEKYDMLEYLFKLKPQLENFNKSKFFWKEDNFSGRCYNFFTNKSEEIERLITFKEKKLSKLDIVSSQIYFFTQLEKCNFLKEYNIDKNNINIDKKFKDIVLNDDIYTFIQEKLGLFTRNEAKVKLLTLFYGSLSSNKNSKIIDLFKKEFPNTYNTIEFFKNFRTFDEKFENIGSAIYAGKKCEWERNTFFNYVLQKFEKDSILKALDNTSEYYTKHDSVSFESGREEEFHTLFIYFFKSMEMDIPKFKTDEGKIQIIEQRKNKIEKLINKYMTVTAEGWAKETAGMLSKMEDDFLKLFNKHKAIPLDRLYISKNDSKMYWVNNWLNTHIKYLIDKKMMVILTREEFETKLEDLTFSNLHKNSKILVGCNYYKILKQEMIEKQKEESLNLIDDDFFSK